jgi:hypothetical protein
MGHLLAMKRSNKLATDCEKVFMYTIASEGMAAKSFFSFCLGVT